jgi:hypothetical protein
MIYDQLLGQSNMTLEQLTYTVMKYQITIIKITNFTISPGKKQAALMDSGKTKRLKEIKYSLYFRLPNNRYSLYVFGLHLLVPG